MTPPPLIAHVIHHLIMGGLENGLVNLVNNMPASQYRHAIVCMSHYSDFSKRIARDDVQIYAINRKPGRDPAAAWRLWRLLRELKPSVVHSRNLSGLNALLPAALAGIRCRIHGEHGWSDHDPGDGNAKYRFLRKLHRPIVSHYVALSAELESYLTHSVGIPADRITRIYNGVDVDKFQPGRPTERPGPFRGSETTVIGTVGRFQKIKDPMNLAQAFVSLLRTSPDIRNRVGLAMVGEGPERTSVTDYLSDAGALDRCWLPGAREDVDNVLRSFDVFVQPSLGEGISNTILEAMATGLPVVATRVGGNPELIDDGNTGLLVPAADSDALASAIEGYLRDPELRARHGESGRRRCVRKFSLSTMVESYRALYDRSIATYAGNA